MRIVICWGGVSGYMAACWRELASRAGVDLLVFNFRRQLDTAFNDEQVMAGIPHRMLPIDHPDAAGAIRQMILDHRADVVSLSGWVAPAYLDVAHDPALANIPLVMVMDTPLRRTWRQRLARLKVGRYVDRMSRVIVPGERAWQYARFLDVPEHKAPASRITQSALASGKSTLPHPAQTIAEPAPSFQGATPRLGSH